MAIEIVDFPMKVMVIFHGKMLVHQRVFQNLLVLNVGWLDGLLGVAGMIITSDDWDHSLIPCV